MITNVWKEHKKNTMKRIGIVGCGNLGVSLLKGIKQNDDEALIYGSKRNISGISHLQDEKTIITSDNLDLIANCEIIILALKPYTILPFLKENASYFNPKKHTIVSVATGITITEMKICFSIIGYFQYTNLNVYYWIIFLVNNTHK